MVVSIVSRDWYCYFGGVSIREPAVAPDGLQKPSAKEGRRLCPVPVAVLVTVHTQVHMVWRVLVKLYLVMVRVRCWRVHSLPCAGRHASKGKPI